MRKAVIAWMLLGAMLLTGCSEYGLGERAIVKAIYLDREEGMYKARLLVLETKPSAEAGDVSEEIQCVVGEGETLFDALNNAEKKENKSAFYGQNELLLISQELAKTELFEACRTLEKETSGRPNIAVYALELDDADETLKEEGFTLLERVEQMQKKGGFRTHLYELSAQSDGLLPLIRYEDESAQLEQLIFYKDERQQGRWQQNQMPLAALLAGQRAPVRLELALDDQAVRFEVSGPRVLYQTEGEGEDLRLTVSLVGRIDELVYSGKTENPEELEPRINQKIQQELEELCRQSFEKENDLFHFCSWLQNRDAAGVIRLEQEGKLWEPDRVRFRSRLYFV